jgi:hypothetical protein
VTDATTTETVIIRNMPNNVLTRFPCTICGGLTEKQAYLFRLPAADGNEVVCDHCAEHPQNIPVYARHQIEHLRDRIADLEFMASRAYVTEVVPCPGDLRGLQRGMYGEDEFAPWMRQRLGLPHEYIEDSEGRVIWVTPDGDGQTHDKEQ